MKEQEKTLDNLTSKAVFLFLAYSIVGLIQSTFIWLFWNKAWSEHQISWYSSFCTCFIFYSFIVSYNSLKVIDEVVDDNTTDSKKN